MSGEEYKVPDEDYAHEGGEGGEYYEESGDYAVEGGYEGDETHPNEGYEEGYGDHEYYKESGHVELIRLRETGLGSHNCLDLGKLLPELTRDLLDWDPIHT